MNGIESRQRVIKNSVSSHPISMRYRIHRIYQQLATAPSLDPGKKVNRLFSQLVRISLMNGEDAAGALLEDPIIKAIQENLQRICSVGEYRLEHHWAKRLSAMTGVDLRREIERFPYYRNYEKLARLEWNALQSVRRRPVRKVLFVGCGPLPLTSLILAKNDALQVDNIEIDHEAYQLAAGLANRLPEKNRLRFYHADILDFKGIDAYDAVFLAALVGLKKREKRSVIRHIGISMRERGLLLIRSAQHLKTLLYPPVDLDRLGNLTPLIEIHPHQDVINSVIIAQKRKSGQREVCDGESFDD